VSDGAPADVSGRAMPSFTAAGVSADAPGLHVVRAVSDGAPADVSGRAMSSVDPAARLVPAVSDGTHANVPAGPMPAVDAASLVPAVPDGADAHVSGRTVQPEPSLDRAAVLPGRPIQPYPGLAPGMPYGASVHVPDRPMPPADDARHVLAGILHAVVVHPVHDRAALRDHAAAGMPDSDRSGVPAAVDDQRTRAATAAARSGSRAGRGRDVLAVPLTETLHFHRSGGLAAFAAGPLPRESPC